MNRVGLGVGSACSAVRTRSGEKIYVVANDLMDELGL
jgi:hypothetical protein